MKHISALNSLRFIGALCVIFSHMGPHAFLKEIGMTKYYILVSGSTGVQLFYVLSGFLITVLAMTELKKNGVFSVKQFFMRRVLRLFPLYYLAVFCIVLLDLLGFVNGSKTSYLYAIFYAYNFVPRAEYHSILGSFHTLGTEEQFYLAFGLLIGVFGLLGRRMVFILFPITLLIALIFLDSLKPYFADYARTHFLGRWVIFASKSILIGCLGGMIFSSTIVVKTCEKIAVNEKLKSAFGFFLLFLFLYFYIGQIEKYDVIKMSIGFLCLVLFLCIYENSWTSKILSWEPFVYLGRISYGLYVWQSVFHGTGTDTHWLRDPLLSFGLIFFVSVISYELYEKRFLSLKEKFR